MNNRINSYPISIVFLMIILTSLLVTGCDTGFYKIIARSASEPQSAMPRVVSFNSLNGIAVSWDADTLADSFILYRRILPSGPVVAVYEGSACSYFDSNVLIESIYQYTLCKVRGTKQFAAGTPAYGAFDDAHVKDLIKNNDSIETAVELSTYTIEDRLYCYSDAMGITLEDRDWFYMDVPSGWVAEIVLTYAAIAPGVIPAYLAVETNQFIPVSTGNTFKLQNGTNVQQRMYFCIQTNPSFMTVSSKFAMGYTLNLKSLTKFNT